MRWIASLRQRLLSLRERPSFAVFEWEPIPWDAGPQAARVQRAGFVQRARWPLAWIRVDWGDIPDGGIFGKNRDWFVGHDIDYITTFEGEDMILMNHPWAGFPDPPEWGLASRTAGDHEAAWQVWGNFAKLPRRWRLKGNKAATPGASTRDAS